MPQPRIVLPDAEKAAITYLRAVQAVRIGNRNPSEPGEFARVRRIGGASRDRAVDLPTLDVLVWANGHERRMDIARDLRAWLHAAAGTRAGDAWLGGCSDVLGPRRMPDPANAQAEIVMFTVQLAMTPATPAGP